jgi:hypothetical protein
MRFQPLRLWVAASDSIGVALGRGFTRCNSDANLSVELFSYYVAPAIFCVGAPRTRIRQFYIREFHIPFLCAITFYTYCDLSNYRFVMKKIWIG